MQLADSISIDQIKKIVVAIFEQGPVIVKEAYSGYDCATREFKTADDLIENMANGSQKPNAFFSYALYYPEAKGYVFEDRIKLIPAKTRGHTFRFSQNGWGLIQLQCNFRHFPAIECRIAVNSRARALNWFQTYPEFKNPELWDWKIIEKKAGKLVRQLKKLKTAAKLPR